MDFKTTVFIGNLPLSANEEDVRRFFEASAQIAQIKILRNLETRKSKGCGFVYFKSYQAFEKSFSLKNKLLDGQKVRIWQAQKHEDAKATKKVQETVQERK